jgi:hypothetical protein
MPTTLYFSGNHQSFQRVSGEIPMKLKIAALAALMSLFMTTVPAFSHHSDAAYGTTSIALKSATIVKVIWANPHGIVSCDVKEENGKVTRWNLEMGSPSAMELIGWNRNSLTPGDVVTIDINPARNGTNLGRLLRVTSAGGKVLDYRAVK